MQTAVFDWVVVNDGEDPIDAGSLSGVGIAQTVIDEAEHLGRARAAKMGLDAATGDYLMLHDDDDALVPQALERLSHYLDAHSDDIAVTCGYEKVLEEGGRQTLLKRHAPELLPTLYDMAERNRILTIGTLFRASTYREVGGMNMRVDALEDWDLWLRLMTKGDIGVIPDILARQFVRPDTQTGDAANSHRREHEIARVRLLNTWLRADIEAGRTGLGELAHRPHARFIEESRDRLRRAGALKRKIMPWTRKSGSSNTETE